MKRGMLAALLLVTFVNAAASQPTQVQAPSPPSTDLGTFTVSTLPDCSVNARMTAWATDLFGGPGDRVICDGVTWKPVRPLAVLSNAAADMTATPLLTPPTIIITGSIGLGVTRTVTLSNTYAYKGALFRITRKATGTGLLAIGGILTNILTGNWADMEYDGSAWVETASGGLL